ncbi:TolB amino-terminal domain-containing protein [Syntrophus gentianae]|uniref:TolB amino-terminal domain-containing protein n=1 Tax=Syntrophus gentianae TaxID=43775 RepID=A0A1H7XWD7_9BACT|nr:FG-GAP-like repeat-containing protein [Syntrophus gentianae]SEM37993.1 TolB amino-terminal domain-containing protein [Syntrophus gentianae]
MKKILQLLILIFLTALACPLEAKEKSTVAVVPFTVHSADNIEYVRQGISDMLASRIAVEGKITVLSKDLVQEAVKEKAGKELTFEEVSALGKKLKADYVVWGSITKIGNSLSIDGKLVDTMANKSTVGIFAQTQGLDEVIPKINDFAQRIVQQITGSTPSDFSSPVVATPPPPTAPATTIKQPKGSRESEIVSGMKSSKKGTFTSIINPDFIEGAQPLDRKGFWISQKYPVEFRGMAIGDVNGDKLQEVVVIDRNNLYIYQKKGPDFNLLQKIPGVTQDSYIAVDVADINQNGVSEIFVTSVRSSFPNTFVVEWKEGKYATIVKDLRLFLRVIEPSVSAPQLLGQSWGMDEVFNTPVYEIIWDGNQYKAANRMKIPQGLSVYGLTLDDLGMGGSEKIIALDDYDYLRIYQQTEKPLVKLNVFGGSDELVFKSDEVFGGSNTFIEETNKTDLQGNPRRTYINLRILTYDLNKDGKKELVLVKNLSSVGRVLQNVKLFTSSEVYNLEWDGLGLLENWKTRKINGYVADYAFKDIDNDGQNEIVLALVLSTGISIQNRSAFVAYKLAPPQ